jgi:uncharacterized Zn finger protein (UPF0148 family)
MENKEIFRFFSNALIYSIIHDYFRYAERLEEMRFIGEIVFPEDGSAPQFKKEYYNCGEAAEIFIDEIAFSYFRHLTCYIPDNGKEDNPEDGCTYSDFLEIAEGNTAIARHLFDEVNWEYPSTLYEQWDATGALDELQQMYSELPTVHFYTSSGDFVHCSNCDKIMLRPTGADKCPACYREGTLAWEDENRQETSLSELEESGKYKVTVQNEAEASKYLSDKTLMGEFETCPDFRFRNRDNNHWEIIDNSGVLYSGEQDVMESIFRQIVEKEKDAEWKGDLKLIEVHCIYN